MKNLILGCLILFIIILQVACRSTKKIGQAISKKDTASVTITPRITYEDTLQYISGLMDSMRLRHLPFSTFSAKTKVVYANKEGKQPDFIAFIRMQKDSVIWLSLANDIGIEGIRMLITPDSIKVMDKLAKTIQIRPLSSLQEISQIPFSFTDLQKILIGEPIFFDKETVYSYSGKPNEYTLYSHSGMFRNAVSISGDYYLEKSRIDDLNTALNRRADLFYKEYEWQNNILFSTLREIFISYKDNFSVQMKFKDYQFNQILSFPFVIPKKFKKIP
jgi:hypothetical protein